MKLTPACVQRSLAMRGRRGLTAQRGPLIGLYMAATLAQSLTWNADELHATGLCAARGSVGWATDGANASACAAPVPEEAEDEELARSEALKK
eukprot:6196051-Pleurochrysis_carterae.AAC.3